MPLPENTPVAVRRTWSMLALGRELERPPENLELPGGALLRTVQGPPEPP